MYFRTSILAHPPSPFTPKPLQPRPFVQVLYGKVPTPRPYLGFLQDLGGHAPPVAGETRILEFVTTEVTTGAPANGSNTLVVLLAFWIAEPYLFFLIRTASVLGTGVCSSTLGIIFIGEN